jgi:hypothetical protein
MASGEVSAARITISEVPRFSVLVAVQGCAVSIHFAGRGFGSTYLHWHPSSAGDSDSLVEPDRVSVARAARQQSAMLLKNQYQYKDQEELSMGGRTCALVHAGGLRLAHSGDHGQNIADHRCKVGCLRRRRILVREKFRKTSQKLLKLSTVLGLAPAAHHVIEIFRRHPPLLIPPARDLSSSHLLFI